MPTELEWTDTQLRQSLDATLEARPDGPIWVFAYGSLIWNPLLEFAAQDIATLDGWHRSFCLRTIAARGTPKHPGRVLGLEPRGTTQGVAYRLPEEQFQSELRMLWAREMGSGVYRPTWGRLVLGSGEVASGIAFVVNTNQALYEADTSAPTVIARAAKAVGAFGSNTDYILKLADALHARGLSDPYVSEIADALR
ncbi:Cation transport protein ChaC [Cupriavidus taiwanensis]|nr:Cation transport protein ChaC [Cupriavidus taiwanensis]